MERYLKALVPVFVAVVAIVIDGVSDAAIDSLVAAVLVALTALGVYAVPNRSA